MRRIERAAQQPDPLPGDGGGQVPAFAQNRDQGAAPDAEGAGAIVAGGAEEGVGAGDGRGAAAKGSVAAPAGASGAAGADAAGWAVADVAAATWPWSPPGAGGTALSVFAA